MHNKPTAAHELSFGTAPITNWGPHRISLRMIPKQTLSDPSLRGCGFFEDMQQNLMTITTTSCGPPIYKKTALPTQRFLHYPQMRHVSKIGLVFENRSWNANQLFVTDPVGHTSTAVAQVEIRIAYQILTGIQDIGEGRRAVLPVIQTGYSQTILGQLCDGSTVL